MFTGYGRAAVHHREGSPSRSVLHKGNGAAAALVHLAQFANLPGRARCKFASHAGVGADPLQRIAGDRCVWLPRTALP